MERKLDIWSNSLSMSFKVLSAASLVVTSAVRLFNENPVSIVNVFSSPLFAPIWNTTSVEIGVGGTGGSGGIGRSLPMMSGGIVLVSNLSPKNDKLSPSSNQLSS